MKKLAPFEEPAMFCQWSFVRGFVNQCLQLSIVQLVYGYLLFLKCFCVLGGQKMDKKLVKWLIKGEELLFPFNEF